MLFPYFPLSELDVSAVRTQKENLKQFELTQFAHYEIYDLITNRTQFCDHLLRDLWLRFGLVKDNTLTLIAVGDMVVKKCFLCPIWISDLNKRAGRGAN